jgi:hypothetical protein
MRTLKDIRPIQQRITIRKLKGRYEKKGIIFYKDKLYLISIYQPYGKVSTCFPITPIGKRRLIRFIQKECGFGVGKINL